MKKIIFIALLLIGCGFLTKRAGDWVNPFGEVFDQNYCIYADKNQQQVTLTSMGHNFDVHYVQNAKADCIASYFPAIHIATECPHNRWLYSAYYNNRKIRLLIRTNAKIMQKLYSEGSKGTDDHEKDDLVMKQLEEEFSSPDLSWGKALKFYSLDQDFFANDGDFYTIFDKKISPWMGHAYAVQVDDKQKTVQCVGGISWGFRLPWWSLRPVMILPAALTQEDWQTDLPVFQGSLKEYTFVAPSN